MPCRRQDDLINPVVLPPWRWNTRQKNTEMKLLKSGIWHQSIRAKLWMLPKVLKKLKFKLGTFTVCISYLDSRIRAVLFAQSKLWQKRDRFRSLLQLFPNFASKQFTVLRASEKIVTKESIFFPIQRNTTKNIYKYTLSCLLLLYLWNISVSLYKCASGYLLRRYDTSSPPS